MDIEEPPAVALAKMKKELHDALQREGILQNKLGATSKLLRGEKTMRE